MLASHEYANKYVVPKKKQRDGVDSQSTGPIAGQSPASLNGGGASAPNSDPMTSSSTAPSNSPPQTPKNVKHSSANKSINDVGGTPNNEHNKHNSLNSSRRAPLSPSVSRRASGANTSVPTTLSRAPSNATQKSSLATTSETVTTPKRRSRSIRIRDFAYPVTDPRHTGQGPDAPNPGHVQDPNEYDPSDSQRNSGWGAFRWAGSKLWGLATGKRSSTAQADDTGFVPSHIDFERNFDASSPADEYPDDGYDDDEGYYEDPQDYPDQDVPLLPGLYRAMYAFVPEGTAEMALTEDQVVRIIGRGGGVGWAIAEDENGGHALVPESYLELVELDNSHTGSD